MVNFNRDIGAACRRALETDRIYWKVEKDFRHELAKRRQCCRNCKWFDENPYLPCAIDPLVAALPDSDNACRHFERKGG